ncbi:MAG: hypothetical protein [Bacteriophage sp.]|nr:MAG: hypothetical protein [Bacteriophage sp.]
MELTLQQLKDLPVIKEGEQPELDKMINEINGENKSSDMKVLDGILGNGNPLTDFFKNFKTKKQKAREKELALKKIRNRKAAKAVKKARKINYQMA